jgi:hypothetical protein
MVIVLIIKVASPNPEMAQEFLSDFDILVVDEGGEVVNVVGWFIEVLDGD